MTMRSRLAGLFLQEDLNFLLTNRIPRLALTRFMGWFSKIEQPLIRDLSIALWKSFADLDLAKRRKPALTACTTASSANSRTARAASTQIRRC